MVTRLVLVRHGESHHKVEGVLGGPRGCRGLTDVGRQQAARLRDRLACDARLAPPVHLYASILPRAIETARILAPALGGIDVRQECDLCSWHVPPVADGMPLTAFREQYALADGGVFRPFETGSESWAQLVGRVSHGLLGMAQRHPGQTTIAVVHTETIEASFVALGNLPLFRSFDLQVALTSVTEWTTHEDPLAWPPARWTLVRFNDTAHLG